MRALANFEQWFLWFILYSFIGWIYESALCSVMDRKLVNRGFLNGPWCPVYGSGVVLVLLALSKLAGRPALLFLLSAALTTALEYITSWLMEKLFHARWWDYSKQRFNLHGRVCLLGFVAFGAMAVLVVEFVHPLIASLTGRLGAVQMHIVCAALLFILLSDLTLTLITVLDIDKRLRAIRQSLDERLPRGLHRFQLRRLIEAFPRLNFTRYHDEWQRLKERLRGRFEL